MKTSSARLEEANMPARITFTCFVSQDGRRLAKMHFSAFFTPAKKNRSKSRFPEQQLYKKASEKNILI